MFSGGGAPRSARQPRASSWRRAWRPPRTRRARRRRQQENRWISSLSVSRTWVCWCLPLGAARRVVCVSLSGPSGFRGSWRRRQWPWARARASQWGGKDGRPSSSNNSNSRRRSSKKSSSTVVLAAIGGNTSSSRSNDNNSSSRSTNNCSTSGSRNSTSSNSSNDSSSPSSSRIAWQIVL